jgi:multiple sugar transport system permease protein
MTAKAATGTSQLKRETEIRQPLLSRRARQWLGHAVAYIIMSAIALVFLIPIFWMMSTSVKARWDVFAWPTVWIPTTLHWENFREVFTRYPFGRFMLNTLLLALGSIVGEMLSVPLAAYGFARLRFPGRSVLFVLVFGTMIVPFHIKMIPLFAMYVRLNLMDTWIPLLLPSLFGSSFLVFLLTQYMRTFPRDLDDAARIDGCGTWGILYRVLLPLCTPALTIIVVFTFLWTWNSFLQPLIFLKSFNLYPIQLGLALFRGQFSVEWNLLMAATLVSILPILILYFFVQEKLIGGIASVGIKG